MSNKHTPELRPFTLKDTGITLLVRKVSPLLVQDLERKFPKPKPPIEKVNYGTTDEPDFREEFNLNSKNPDYINALNEYNESLEMKTRKLLISRGVSLEITSEIKDQIDELRQFEKEEFGIDLDPSDKMVYVEKIAVGTLDDLQDLLKFILRRAQPTEEAITESVNSFQSEL